MNTCKDCKYWSKIAPVWKFKVKYNNDKKNAYENWASSEEQVDIWRMLGDSEIIGREKVEHKFGDCKCPKIVYTKSGEPSDFIKYSSDSFIYTDGECYFAEHQTGADFGCIHWEEI